MSEEKAIKAAEKAAREATEKATEDAVKGALDGEHPSSASAFVGTRAELAARQQAAEATTQQTAEPKTESKALLEKAGAQILAEYPDARVIYMTSNGFGFFREADARNHAATLQDKAVTTIKR